MSACFALPLMIARYRTLLMYALKGRLLRERPAPECQRRSLPPRASASTRLGVGVDLSLILGLSRRKPRVVRKDSSPRDPVPVADHRRAADRRRRRRLDLVLRGGSGGFGPVLGLGIGLVLDVGTMQSLRLCSTSL